MARHIILDTDIGDDPDDTFALLLALNSPEVSLDLIVTTDEVNGKRARYAKKILEAAGRDDIPVVQGKDLERKTHFVANGILGDYGSHADTNYVDAVLRVMDGKDEILYVGIGPMSNLSHILQEIPRLRDKLTLYQMACIKDDKPPYRSEHNFKVDPEAGKRVFSSGAHITLVTSDVTTNPVLAVSRDSEIYKRLRESSNPVHRMLADQCDAFYQHRGYSETHMHDPLTLGVAITGGFVAFINSGVEVNGEGRIRLVDTKPKMYVSIGAYYNEFMNFLQARLFDQ